ncbi:MAG: 50S ribosomal protein L34e [Nanobdellota archaeon]
MPNRNKRSNSFRKVKNVTPGHRNVVNYVRKKHKQGLCPATGEKLKGVPRSNKGTTKSQRRPERPFGGVLSSKASRSILKKKARQ